MTNLRALLDRAHCVPATLEREARLQSIFKVYVRNRDHLDAVRRVTDDPFFASSHLLYLKAISAARNCWSKSKGSSLRTEAFFLTCTALRKPVEHEHEPHAADISHSRRNLRLIQWKNMRFLTRETLALHH